MKAVGSVSFTAGGRGNISSCERGRAMWITVTLVKLMTELEEVMTYTACAPIYPAGE